MSKPILKPTAKFSEGSSLVELNTVSYSYNYDYHISSGRCSFPEKFRVKAIKLVPEKYEINLILDPSEVVLPDEVLGLHLVLEFGIWGCRLRQYFEFQIDNFQKGRKIKIADSIPLRAAFIPDKYRELQEREGWGTLKAHRASAVGCRRGSRVAAKPQSHSIM